MTFNEVLSQLPTIDHLSAIELFQDNNLIARIENKPGSAGSVRVYFALIQEFTNINKAAASKGVEIYCEHSDDARAFPGKHPNIDRLFEVINQDLIYTAKLIHSS